MPEKRAWTRRGVKWLADCWEPGPRSRIEIGDSVFWFDGIEPFMPQLFASNETRAEVRESREAALLQSKLGPGELRRGPSERNDFSLEEVYRGPAFSIYLEQCSEHERVRVARLISDAEWRPGIGSKWLLWAESNPIAYAALAVIPDTKRGAA